MIIINKLELLFGFYYQEVPMLHSNRISRLTDLLQGAGLEALALNAGPSLTYLTGFHFHLSERPIVAIFTTDHEPVIILPELEMLKVAGMPVRAFPYPEKPSEWKGIFCKAVQSLRLDGNRIGVEPRQMRVLEFRLLEVAVETAGQRPVFPEAAEMVSTLRVRKDADEIAAIRKAVNVAQSALETTIPQIKIGMSEKELASELVVQLLRHGSHSEMPFAPIISGGPNSANPHASPSERTIRNGDMLVVDWGAAVDDYISDLTRTFAVGEVDAEYRKIHQIVLEANHAGRTAGKPGVPCATVDKAARDVIEKSGYGEYFTHRCGHGIGMEGHEEPYLRSDNLQLLEPGMAYTVEPGIYLPGRNGVRIEDNIVITETGAECLSDMHRGLQMVG
jgi:Xaa-Pro dipeptidase